MTDYSSGFEQWKSKFDKLENDIESFRDYFNQTKNCRCSIESCKHFKKARNQVFGERIDYLYNLRMQISFQTYKKIIKPIITN